MTKEEARGGLQAAIAELGTTSKAAAVKAQIDVFEPIAAHTDRPPLYSCGIGTPVAVMRLHVDSSTICCRNVA